MVLAFLFFQFSHSSVGDPPIEMYVRMYCMVVEARGVIWSELLESKKNWHHLAVVVGPSGVYAYVFTPVTQQ